MQCSLDRGAAVLGLFPGYAYWRPLLLYFTSEGGRTGWGLVVGQDMVDGRSGGKVGTVS
jgi:hypothetical protein